MCLLESMKTRPTVILDGSSVSVSTVGWRPKPLLIYSWFLIPSRMAGPILALTGQHSQSQTAVLQDWAQQHARASFPASILHSSSLCQHCVVASHRPASLSLQRRRSAQSWCSRLGRIISAAVCLLLMLACALSHVLFIQQGKLCPLGANLTWRQQED